MIQFRGTKEMHAFKPENKLFDSFALIFKSTSQGSTVYDKMFHLWFIVQCLGARGTKPSMSSTLENKVI
jgi:hypothetical protein